MPQRRRYATRDELVQMLVDRSADRESVERLLDMIAEFGVDLGALVKITVDEDVSPDLQ
jgi:hypothetical protein